MPIPTIPGDYLQKAFEVGQDLQKTLDDKNNRAVKTLIVISGPDTEHKVTANTEAGQKKREQLQAHFKAQGYAIEFVGDGKRAVPIQEITDKVKAAKGGVCLFVFAHGDNYNIGDDYNIKLEKTGDEYTTPAGKLHKSMGEQCPDKRVDYIYAGCFSGFAPMMAKNLPKDAFIAGLSDPRQALYSRNVDRFMDSLENIALKESGIDGFAAMRDFILTDDTIAMFTPVTLRIGQSDYVNLEGEVMRRIGSNREKKAAQFTPEQKTRITEAIFQTVSHQDDSHPSKISKEEIGKILDRINTGDPEILENKFYLRNAMAAEAILLEQATSQPPSKLPPKKEPPLQK